MTDREKILELFDKAGISILDVAKCGIDVACNGSEITFEFSPEGELTGFFTDY